METLIYTSNTIDAINDLLKNDYQKILILSDKNLYVLYEKEINSIKSHFGSKAIVYIISPGENSKSIANVMEIVNFMISNGFQRDSLIINYGGGVVSDLGGFISSNYLRGIDYINIPTSIIGQIDAALGGKTAINTFGIKNNFGSFYSPLAVVLNPNYIKTLNQLELDNGYGEVFKYQILMGDKELIFKEYNEILEACVKYKTSLVKKDKKDLGLRQYLNLGHTIGHGIEASQKIPHGVAIAYGTLATIDIAKSLSLTDNNFIKEAANIFNQIGINYTNEIKNLNKSDVINKINHDKKIKRGKINWILPINWGKIIQESIDQEVWVESLDKLIRGELFE
jgi:3-dehydroquinate synthase